MKIAVIGSGISGLSSAYLLSTQHTVTLFEAAPRLGGHTHTHNIERSDGNWSVDTGFIVFNERTYPNFIRLMKLFGIEGRLSNMSFSVRNEVTGFEYKASTLDTIFAQRGNLLNPAMYRLISEIYRFKKESAHFLDKPDGEISLEAYLKENKFSELFITHFILPMGAAIWSSSIKIMMNFPAQFFMRFFQNHGFLEMKSKPNWFTVPGGSSSYIPHLVAPLEDRIHLDTPIRNLMRYDDHVELFTDEHEPLSFDCAVIATHADQALKIISDLTNRERDVLSAFPYQANKTILHMDTGLMPTKRKAWASWNYHITKYADEPVGVSYNMNILQGLKTRDNFIVSLNRSHGIVKDKILRTMNYHHPIFTEASIPAQQQQDAINGQKRTYFCGAYWRYGFHEDGLVSALNVCRRFGIDLEDLE